MMNTHFVNQCKPKNRKTSPTTQKSEVKEKDREVKDRRRAYSDSDTVVVFRHGNLWGPVWLLWFLNCFKHFQTDDFDSSLYKVYCFYIYRIYKQEARHLSVLARSKAEAPRLKLSMSTVSHKISRCTYKMIEEGIDVLCMSQQNLHVQRGTTQR